MTRKRNITSDLNTLPLQIRTISILKENGIRTVDELIQIDENQLSKIKYLGRTGTSDINNVLKSIDSLLLSPGTLSVLKQAGINNVVQLFALRGNLSSLKNLTNAAMSEINLATLTLEELPLQTRSINALKKSGIVFTGQLMRLSLSEIRNIKNIGAISFCDIKEFIIKERGQLQDVDFRPTNPFRESKESTLLSDKYYSGKIEVDLTPVSREAFIEDLLATLKPRESLITIRRYGLIGGVVDTLADIGTDFGLTRERIRQIQNKSIVKLKKTIWSSKYVNIINLLNDFIHENGYVVTDDEIDKSTQSIFNLEKYDGSSILDLLTDIGLYNRYCMKSFCFYTVNKDKIDVKIINDCILSFIEKENVPLSLSSIIEHTQNNRFIKSNIEILEKIVKKICDTNPQIEKVGNLYIRGRYSTKRNIELIKCVLRVEDTPLHFTEIAERVNNMLSNNTSLDVRLIHKILIENDSFSHTGKKGTYALTSWGFRKETTSELCKEYIQNAGFPVHWLQIYNYITKYKNSSKFAIRNILDNSGHFVHLGKGIYDVKR